jgi:2,3-bisphosphoglycerate-independent phosphoglycerate mutase
VMKRARVDKPRRMLLLFVDGWGLAAAGSDNPFSLATMPHAKELWGGLTSNHRHIHEDSIMMGLDATFGIAGLPQSATGQTALFTGLPVPHLLGEHRPGLPGPEVTTILRKSNLFTVAFTAGAKPTFANTYTQRYLSEIDRGTIHPSCTTVMCRMVPGGIRLTREYRVDRAISHDLSGEWLHLRVPSCKLREPVEAGRIVRRLLHRHRLVLFEHFRLDAMAHAQNREVILRELGRYDEFLGGLLEQWDGNDWLVLASDHGNVEDLSTAGHTRNPALLAGWGRGVGRLGKCKDVAELGLGLMKELTT